MIFWISRGHRGRLFPPVRAFVSIANRVQHSHCSSIFIECCPLTLLCFPLINFYASNSPYEYTHSVTISILQCDVDFPITVFRHDLLRQKKLHLPPSTSPLLNTRPTELLVPGATTAISLAEPPLPPISRAGLKVSLVACLKGMAQMVHIPSA